MFTPDSRSSQRIEHSSIHGSQIQQGQAGKKLTQIQAENLTQNYITVFGRDRPAKAEKLRLDLADQLLKNRIQPELKQRLRNTIYQEVWLNPELEEQPHQVGELTPNRLVQVVGKPAETLDLQTTILEVFAQYKKLLILGEPGIGKTTTLLTLADQLVEQAIANPGTAIPVVFELSAWKDNNQSIEEWLVQQLTKMRVSAKIAKGWLKKDLLIPLLDGLDELEPTRQEICVQRLNQFAEHYPYLVLCCRAEEYEAGLKLDELHSAVRLQPLTPTQIQGYLQQVGRQKLWESVTTHTEKQIFLHPDAEGKPGILQIPLFLKIAAEVGKPFSHQSELLEAYTDQRLRRDVVNWERRHIKLKQWAYGTVHQAPCRKRTKHYLSWLARYMKLASQIEFMIEAIAIDHTVDSVKETANNPTGIAWNRKALSIRQNMPHRCFLIYNSLWFSMTAIPFSLLCFSVSFSNSTDFFHTVISGIWGLGYCFIVSMFSSQLLAANLQNQIDYRSQKTIVFICIVIIFIITLAITVGLLDSYGLFDKFNTFQQSNYQERSNVLLGGIAYGVWSIVLFLTSLPDINSVNGWLPVKKIVNFQPNQGIRDSFKRFLAIFLVTVILMPLPLMPRETLQAMVDDEKILDFLRILGVSTLVGSLLGLLYGGMACAKHFSMRLVLYAIAKVIPWDYARFLDYCVERRLLQRIGGRYRFLHRELLEHFADKAGGVS